MYGSILTIANNMPLKVFIVEDSNIIRLRLYRLLSLIKGIEIAGIANNSKDALESIKKHSPVVVILDVSISNGDGIKMIKDIKNIHPHNTVIMFTTFDHRTYRDKSFKLGADFYLDKSVDFEKLTDIFEELKKKNSSPDLLGIF